MDLRDRLKAFSKGNAAPPRAAAAPLPYLKLLESEHGQTYYTDKIFIELHGEIDLKDFPEICVETLRFLSLDHSLTDFSLKDTVFLDIETTGTAGGTGTYAFLVGLGFVEDGFFQVRQFFLHDLAHESAFLHAVAGYCGRFKYLITYNGKCFDSQILRNRYLMHRREDPLAGKPHIDMLFIARRLWKRRFRECDLMNLEREVLRFFRSDDIPGYMIPSAYTDYLRFANASLIQKVIHHNQWDILSLAVLTARACLLQVQENDLSPEERFSLSLLYERHKDYSRAVYHQLKALDSGGSLRHLLLLRLSRNFRRLKDREQIQWLVGQAEWNAMDEELALRLCILAEHELKDYKLALQLVQTQLERIEKFRGLGRRHDEITADWRHRHERLQRKSFSVPLR